MISELALAWAVLVVGIFAVDSAVKAYLIKKTHPAADLGLSAIGAWILIGPWIVWGTP